MPTSQAVGTNGEQRHAYAITDEQTPLLPHHDRRKAASAASSRSISAFLRAQAFSPLPAFHSDSDPLPSAYLPPLVLQCIITGLADASTFTLTRTWVGFMTGNMVQMIINTCDVLLPSDSNVDGGAETVGDKLRSNIGSLVGFAIGCQITAHVIQRLATTRTKRIALVLFSLYRSVATLLIILLGIRYPAFRLSGSLGWLVIMILASNLGGQSTYSTSLATPFSNTVVFTATLTSVSSDLLLTELHLSSSNKIKLLSIFGLLGGAALSQFILKVATTATKGDQHEAVERALIVLSAAELLLGLAWFLCGIVDSWRQYRRRSSESTSNGLDEQNEDHLD
ncbi:hypothetical protein EX895_003854 [Sporisorium graminicola]|uniref:DUF1275 domain protein n=1 Tax=Sporisorium graminicola TaxID=280036 RepID=A0A4U7KT10_9BASI|nr:hypothetical protein EX895_003854 [Sporisorium graminicola]TKY87177.1 hypothetical protein EX895_003854 [Sporisorium graminicola]